MTNEPSQQLAKAGDTGVALYQLPTKDDLAMVQESIGSGEKLDISLLQRVKVGAGGSTSWDVIGGEPTRVIEGVLILRHPVRAYWNVRFADGGGGNPPDCSSMDNQIGIGNNGQPGTTHECANCPLAEWGTAVDEKGEPAAGKACRQITRVYMLRQGRMLPQLIALPPSSYREALMYSVQTPDASSDMGQRRAYYGVLTRMTLVQDKAKQSGVTYAKVKFEMVRPLNDAENAQAVEYRDQIMPFLNSLSIVDVEASDRDIS